MGVGVWLFSSTLALFLIRVVVRASVVELDAYYKVVVGRGVRSKVVRSLPRLGVEAGRVLLRRFTAFRRLMGK